MECSIGECVYVQASPDKPYRIFRIEDIKKKERDEKSQLIFTVRRFYRRIELGDCIDENEIIENFNCPLDVKDAMQFRELLCDKTTRDWINLKVVEKCKVDMLQGVESLPGYLEKEDYFFYCRKYNHNSQKSKVLGSKSIKKYQMIPIELNIDSVAKHPHPVDDHCDLEWDPNNNLTDEEINCFTDAVRGYTSSHPHKFNRMDASERAHDLIKTCKYSLYNALSSLLDKDDFPEKTEQHFTDQEIPTFERALRFTKKNFPFIQRKYFPNRSIEFLVDFYYKHKADKLTKNFKKTKALKVATVTLSGPSLAIEGSAISCECCSTETCKFHFAYPNKSTVMKVCQSCWLVWKKYGKIVGQNNNTDSKCEIDDESDDDDEEEGDDDDDDEEYGDGSKRKGTEKDDDYEPPTKKKKKRQA